MPKKGSKRKKTRTHVKPVDPSADPTAAKIPKSFVVKSGTVGGSVAALVRDVRKVLEPNTGSRIRERKANRLRDFVAMSGPLGVTHLLVFSQPPASSALIPLAQAAEPVETTAAGKKNAKAQAEERAEKSLSEGTTTLNLRLIRLPRGPTLGFKVLRYSLASDILRMARRPRSIGREFAEGPLLILSGFGGEDKQLKLMTTVFQNLFPPIHVQTMPLASARRVVLLSYNAETHTIDFRHYLISVRPVGVSRPIRKIIAGSTANKALPASRKRERSMSVGSSDDDSAGVSGMGARGKGVLDLGRAEDISDYVLRHEGMGFVTSDSEMSDQSDGGSQSGHSSGSEEDERKGKVRLASDYVGRGNRGGNVKGEKRAVRLVELGPRMELGLVKVEEGVGEGEVMFHEMVHKSVSEAAKLSKAHAARRKLAAERKAAQQVNVDAKKAAKKLAAGGDDAEVEGEDADEEDDEDKIDSDNSFDYDDEHGLAGVDSEEEVSEGDDDSEEYDDEEEDEDEEDQAAQLDHDDSDLSPFAYNSNDEDDDLSQSEEDVEAAPAPGFVFRKKDANRTSAGAGPNSFKHKTFVKQERAPAKAAAGIHHVKVEKKKKTEDDDEGDDRGGSSRGRGGRGRGGDRGRGSDRGGRGGRGGGERGGRGGFVKRGESSRGSSRGGRGRGRN